MIDNDKKVTVDNDKHLVIVDKDGNSVSKDVDGNVIEDVQEDITEATAEVTANHISEKYDSVLIFAVIGAAALLLISVVAGILVKRKNLAFEKTFRSISMKIFGKGEAVSQLSEEEYSMLCDSMFAVSGIISFVS